MTKAIVIGGGIGGLCAAHALVQNGVDAVVYEQSDELREIGASVGLQIRAMKALRAAGFFDAIMEVAQPIERLEIRSWKGGRLASVPVAEIGRKLGAPAVTIHRGELLEVLARELIADGRIVLAARAVGCRQDNERATVCFADGKEISGDLLVGADGIRSLVRVHLVGETELRDPHLVAWRAMPKFEHDAIARGIAHLAIGHGRLFGLFPGSRERTCWFASGAPLPGGTPPRDRWKEQLLSDYEGWYVPVREVISATDVWQIYHNPLTDRKPRTQWGRGRITLVGDAAHAMLPTLGQGAGQAIEDGVALAATLREAGSLEASDSVAKALRRYESERIPPTSAIVKESWDLGKTYHWRNPIACWVRDTAFRLVPNAIWRRRSTSGLV